MNIVEIIVINNPMEITKSINFNFSSKLSGALVVVLVLVVELVNNTVVTGIGREIIPFKQSESQLIFSIESGV